MKRTALKRSTGEARTSVLVPRRRKCEHCKEQFVQVASFQTWCSSDCGYEIAKARLAKKEQQRQSAERKADKVKREKLKPKSYWEKLAERQVNRYVRLRDAHLGCISCDKPANWGGQWHASHFRSVGAASAVRFHLWNISKGCSQCNKWLSGNIAAYEPRLRAKLGDERVDWLKTQNQIVRHSIEYLKRLKTVFSRKANRLAKRLASTPARKANMFGLLRSIADLTTNVVKVVAAPVEIVVDLADAAVKPVAEVVEALVEDVKSLKD